MKMHSVILTWLIIGMSAAKVQVAAFGSTFLRPRTTLDVRRSSTLAVNVIDTSMFFEFVKKSADSSNGGRPVAEGTVKGAKKTKIVQEVSSTASRGRRQVGSSKTVPTKKLQGLFTPKQFAAFERARREVPSGSGQAYWEQIASRVPGQDAAACKGMAESQLFRKAVGTQSNFFGGYIDVKETPDYVDEDADVMGKLAKFFGGGKR